MFIRVTKTASGKATQLVESYRDREGRPRQRLVVSLGSLDIPKPYRRVVGREVQEALRNPNQPVLIPPSFPAEVVEWIDYIVKRVQREGQWCPASSRPQRQAAARHEGCADNPRTVDGVVIDELSHTHDTPLGCVLLGLHAWRQLRMPQLLTELGMNEAQRQAAAALVINRLDDPVTEHSMPEWLTHSSLPDLLGETIVTGGDDRFYRVGDKLLECQSQIEAHVRSQQTRLFALQRTVLLYDLTNTHFEGICAANPKAKRGINKQKRNDCPQIVIGMVFDEEGFELAHRTFQGNMNDSRSLLRMVGELHQISVSGDALAACCKPLVIMDSGVATKANRRILRQNDFSYLVNDTRQGRKRWPEEFDRDDFEQIPARHGRSPVSVRMRDVTTEEMTREGDSETVRERFVFCRSEGRREKELAIRSRAEQRLLEALEKLSVRVSRGRLKDPEKIQRAIGRVLQKNPRVARYYHVEFVPPAAGHQCGSVRWRRHDQKWLEADGLLGCYVLRTDRDEFTAAELWQIYMTLSRAEAGFRMLKSDLGLRPNYHRLEDRVDAHVFITVLAYHLLSYIHYVLQQKGDTRCWATLKRVLQTHCYATIVMPTVQGKTHRLRKPGIPEACQQAIYSHFDIDCSRLPKTQIVVNTPRMSTL